MARHTNQTFLENNENYSSGRRLLVRICSCNYVYGRFVLVDLYWRDKIVSHGGWGL